MDITCSLHNPTSNNLHDCMNHSIFIFRKTGLQGRAIASNNTCNPLDLFRPAYKYTFSFRVYSSSTSTTSHLPIASPINKITTYPRLPENNSSSRQVNTSS
uniref:Uncharacterized protein n=1 Tax=Arundo donax TaxID=35708 RepID=A0A0A9RDC2_ARUDO